MPLRNEQLEFVEHGARVECCFGSRALPASCLVCNGESYAAHVFSVEVINPLFYTF